MDQVTAQKTFLRGVIYFDGNPCAVDCLVRELSASGARIELLRTEVAHAGEIELQIPLKSQKHHGRVIARTDSELEVTFLVSGRNSEKKGDVAQRIASLEAQVRELKKVIRGLSRDRCLKPGRRVIDVFASKALLIGYLIRWLNCERAKGPVADQGRWRDPVLAVRPRQVCIKDYIRHRRDERLLPRLTRAGRISASSLIFCSGTGHAQVVASP